MLSRAQPENAKLIAGWLADESKRRWLTENLRWNPITEQLVKVAIRRPDQAWYLFQDPSETRGGFVGLVALDHIEPKDGVANLWYVLGDSSRAGQGLTTAAIRALCSTNPMNLKVAMAWAAATNAGSLRCLEKAGFSLLGIVDDAFQLSIGERCARHLFYRRLDSSDLRDA